MHSRQNSRRSNFSYARYADKFFTQVYRDLYGDAMLVPIRMGTNMAVGNQPRSQGLSSYRPLELQGAVR